MITVKDFLAEFTEEHMPRKTGPWISFDAHDPAFKRDQLRAMRKLGIIELDEPARRYRILETALANTGDVARPAADKLSP